MFWIIFALIVGYFIGKTHGYKLMIERDRQQMLGLSQKNNQH